MQCFWDTVILQCFCNISKLVVFLGNQPTCRVSWKHVNLKHFWDTSQLTVFESPSFRIPSWRCSRIFSNPPSFLNAGCKVGSANHDKLLQTCIHKMGLTLPWTWASLGFLDQSMLYQMVTEHRRNLNCLPIPDLITVATNDVLCQKGCRSLRPKDSSTPKTSGGGGGAKLGNIQYIKSNK